MNAVAALRIYSLTFFRNVNAAFIQCLKSGLLFHDMAGENEKTKNRMSG